MRLGKEHGSSNDTSLVIYTRKCLGYLTGPIDPHEILNDQLIVKCKDLWWQMASAEKIVDLFNASTWCGVDYNPLVNLVHRQIALHPIHQQLVENHVQMAALVATTYVEEDRRTWRAMSLSKIMQPFNKNAVDDKK